MQWFSVKDTKRVKNCKKAQALCVAFKDRSKRVGYPDCNCVECLSNLKRRGVLTAKCEECGHRLVSAGKKGKYSRIWRHKKSYIHLVGKPTKKGLQLFLFECVCGCVIERPKP